MNYLIKLTLILATWSNSITMKYNCNSSQLFVNQWKHLEAWPPFEIKRSWSISCISLLVPLQLLHALPKFCVTGLISSRLIRSAGCERAEVSRYCGLYLAPYWYSSLLHSGKHVILALDSILCKYQRDRLIYFLD